MFYILYVSRETVEKAVDNLWKTTFHVKQNTKTLENKRFTQNRETCFT